MKFRDENGVVYEVTSLEQVEAFHKTFGHPVNDKPYIEDMKLNSLRIKLIREELNELEDALMLQDDANLMSEIDRVHRSSITTAEKATKVMHLLNVRSNPKKYVLDALCDIQYVLDGAWLALGFHRAKNEAMFETHASNMSKLGEDGEPIYRDDGKVIKGPNFVEPDYSWLIERLESDEL